MSLHTGSIPNDRTVFCEEGFLTQDPSTLKVLEQARRVSGTDTTLLLQGESGTGKELLAKWIHKQSLRRNAALISINCSALPQHLLLSELFGHEKGSFTGALFQKVGLVELASGGTLFLDEIGEMGLEAQSKLLRFLQEGEIHRIGASAPTRVNVRVLSATHKDLAAEVEAGRFRQDLYYRLNTVTLEIPPLRKRTGDVELLANFFARTPGRGGSTRHMRFSQDALETLAQQHWPGNARELGNLVERCKILLDEEVITKELLPLPDTENESEAEKSFAPEGASFLLDQVEKNHILKVLHHFQGNKTRAAQAMGITVKTLYNKLARYESSLKH